MKIVTETDLLGRRQAVLTEYRKDGAQGELFGAPQVMTSEERSAARDLERWRKKRNEESALGQGELF